MRRERKCWSHNKQRPKTLTDGIFETGAYGVQSPFSFNPLGSQFKNAMLPQRCNRGEIFGATSAMLGQNLPPLVEIGLRYLKI